MGDKDESREREREREIEREREREREKVRLDDDDNCQYNFPQLFYLSGKVQVIINLFVYFDFHPVVYRNSKTL